MARDWESDFQRWSKPPSDSETERCENAVRAIKAALADHSRLSTKDVEVFLQGSYRNRTNVRQESDIDIGAVCLDIVDADYQLSQGMNHSKAGLVDATYTEAMFKDDVHEALVEYFGSRVVKRGNKAFHINENSYRVDADVVACSEHRRYLGSTATSYETGTKLCTDDRSRIVNWPEQHYENGVARNERTSRRFKALVRILKKLRYEMEDAGVAAAGVPSFLVECLVWNAKNDAFDPETCYARLRSVLAQTFNGTLNDADCKEWGEVNERKYLFRSIQPWTRQQANRFLGAAWDYVGYT